jgi:hypothetical protein
LVQERHLAATARIRRYFIQTFLSQEMAALSQEMAALSQEMAAIRQDYHFDRLGDHLHHRVSRQTTQRLLVRLSAKRDKKGPIAPFGR